MRCLSSGSVLALQPLEMHMNPGGKRLGWHCAIPLREEGGTVSVKIHEYQAKDILARYGVPVQPGRIAQTPEEAEAIARQLGGPVVIKAQVYVGGRGKAGGIQFGETPEQARAAASRVLGMEIKGLTVAKVLVTPKVDITQEYYLGIVLD